MLKNTQKISDIMLPTAFSQVYLCIVKDWNFFLKKNICAHGDLNRWSFASLADALTTELQEILHCWREIAQVVLIDSIIRLINDLKYAQNELLRIWLFCGKSSPDRGNNCHFVCFYKFKFVQVGLLLRVKVCCWTILRQNTNLCKTCVNLIRQMAFFL